ncbi:MAG: HAD hydrolase-like protein [Planctomycetota bacterium]
MPPQEGPRSRTVRTPALSPIRGLLVDLDGVLCVGPTRVLWCEGMFKKLRDRVIPRFLTDTTARTAGPVVQKLSMNKGKSSRERRVCWPISARSSPGWSALVASRVKVLRRGARIARAVAERCTEIGDEIETDIGGTEAAGLQGVRVRTGQHRPTTGHIHRPDSRSVQQAAGSVMLEVSHG